MAGGRPRGDASTCWRAGKGAAAHAVDEDLDARRAVRRRRAAYGWPRPRRRRWRGPARGPRNARSSAKARRSWASVSGHSWLRCAMVRRLATVRWQRPSARVGRGRDGRGIGRPHRRGGEGGGAERVAAPSSTLGAERGQPVAVRAGGAAAAGPAPGRGRDCARILAMPCSAAARGMARRRPLLAVAARLPRLRPGIIVARPDDAVEIDLDAAPCSAADREEACRPARGRAAAALAGSSVAAAVGVGRDLAVAGGEIGEPAGARAASSRPSASSPVPASVSSRASRTVRIWSVGADMVGPPSKMST